MDHCSKAPSFISEDLKEPHTLLQLSDVIFDHNQCKMNDSISISEIEVNGWMGVMWEKMMKAHQIV